MIELVVASLVPNLPHAKMWVPECNASLEVAGPDGYRSCVLDALEEKSAQLADREKVHMSYLDEMDDAGRTANYETNRKRWRDYMDSHCSFFGANFTGDAMQVEYRTLSCRYLLLDRRIAELDALNLHLKLKLHPMSGSQ